MQIGLMNNPREDPLTEIRWIGGHGFDFVDLTLEHPRAHRVDAAAVRRALDEWNLSVVGHTDPKLPYAYPLEGVRRACLDELCAQMELFAAVGARVVNIHPSYSAPICHGDALVDLNCTFLERLVEAAGGYGLTVMLENWLTPFGTTAEMKATLDRVPGLALHLDVGHAFLAQPHDPVRGYCERLGGRLAHVHLSDNKGKVDDHLPLGAGLIDWADAARALKASGYDGTVTLEVFSPHREYALASREYWLALWQAAGDAAEQR